MQRSSLLNLHDYDTNCLYRCNMHSVDDIASYSNWFYCEYQKLQNLPFLVMSAPVAYLTSYQTPAQIPRVYFLCYVGT